MILVINECNIRRYLVGLFNSYEDMVKQVHNCTFTEIDVNNPKYGSTERGKKDYNETRAWKIEEDYPDPEPEDYQPHLFGYISCARAYEVNNAPNKALLWDQD